VDDDATFLNSDTIKLYPSGKYVDPFDLHIADINIADIARSLSLQCRFAGHLCQPWSVAQHSLLVSALLPEQYRLWGLLHDAEEAYLPDMTRPVKRRPQMSYYRERGTAAQETIALRYSLSWPEPPIVHRADDFVCLLEKRAFKDSRTELGPTEFSLGLAEGHLDTLRTLSWQVVEKCFMGEFVALCRERQK
jgi:hypothetical protein